jgi:hypothetical protein
VETFYVKKIARPDDTIAKFVALWIQISPVLAATIDSRLLPNHTPVPVPVPVSNLLLRVEKYFLPAHIGVRSKPPVCQRMLFGHVGHLRGQHEIRLWRHAAAVRYRRVNDDMALELCHVSGCPQVRPEPGKRCQAVQQRRPSAERASHHGPGATLAVGTT